MSEKKYTPRALHKAVVRYFRSITRWVKVTESVPTGKVDRMGHQIMEQRPVVNQLGEEMQRLEYVIPPSVGGLCMFLEIHRSTWNDYCKDEKYADTTTHARGVMHAYLEQESLTRQGKDLKGVLFNLENNYGYSERVTVGQTLEELLACTEEGQEF